MKVRGGQEGMMGAGIAESAALAGMSVAMIDVREEALERGMQTIEQDLARRVKKERGDGGPRTSGEEPPEDVALRVISCIVNEAFLAHSENVATAENIDRAMKLGANSPKGPFEWADEIGPDHILHILHTLDSLKTTQGDAYLAAPALRRHTTNA